MLLCPSHGAARYACAETSTEPMLAVPVHNHSLFNLAGAYHFSDNVVEAHKKSAYRV